MKESQPAKPQILKRASDPTSWVIGFLAVSLILFPFISAFNDLLTNWMISLKAYRLISEVIVPQEIKWATVMLRFIGIEAQATREYILLTGSNKNFLFEIIWNCIGWQSFIMFILTTVVMFSGKFLVLSKLKAIVLGIIGTIFVNILRIVVTIWLYSTVGGGFALVFHDYGALLTNTLWLIGFWWFSYEYILEECIPVKHR